MAEWAAKRFWSEAAVHRSEAGFAVHLDARPIRTPAGRPLLLPTAAMAEAVAEEWQAQQEVVEPRTMPMTRAANSALDKVAAQRQATIDLLSEYGGTDLLCYRAEGPDELMTREAAAWDPLLDWMGATFGARLTVTSGIMPVDQPQEALSRLGAPMEEMNDLVLTGFHDLVTLSGSLVIALAVHEGRLAAAEGWRASRVDEDWQAEIWGIDEDAAEEAEIKRQAFLDADRVIGLARGRGGPLPR